MVLKGLKHLGAHEMLLYYKYHASTNISIANKNTKIKYEAFQCNDINLAQSKWQEYSLYLNLGVLQIVKAYHKFYST